MNSVTMIANAVTGPAKKDTPVTAELVERVEARLRAARTKMLFHGNWAFFAYLAMHLKPLAVPGMGTCATDGEFFLYDPVVLDAETVEWLEFDWGHEVLHLFGMDLSRKPADDVMIVLCANCGDGKPCPKGPCPEFSLWNFCADLYNNLKLEEEGFQVPPFVPIDRSLKGMSKDEIYAKYRKNVKKGKGHGQGQSPCDGTGLGLPKGRICGGCKKHGKNGKTENFKPSKDMENLWKQRAKEAVEAARMKGKAPGFAESAIGKLLASHQDWRSILWQFCTRCEHEWRYRPPSRTGAARNIVLPRLCPEDAIEHGVLIIDTSGSISDENLAEFGGEMMSICNSIRMRVTVIMCDAAVQEVFEFEPGEFDWRALKFSGRGGTDFRPPFLKVAKLGITPTFAIYFTDLCGTFPDSAPEYPVLWANVAPGARPPWGQYISLRDETV